jgi:hypothetical protein
MVGMTPLIPEPVILRVVRLIERVTKDLETSDGGFLRKVVHGHTEVGYREELGHESRRRRFEVVG